MPQDTGGAAIDLAQADPTGETQFDAFISYSHTSDRELAAALRRGLHSFAKPWYRRRAMRVFQDASTLESSPDLWATIETALRGARALVLLASPASAESRGVAREVWTWCQVNRGPDGTLRRDRPILIVLTGGEIVWDQDRGDFDWSATTALPRELAGAFAGVPFWLDLRWVRTGERPSPRDPRFRDAIASLAAAIRGRRKDDLIGEDIRVWRRNRRLARSALALLTVLMVTAAGLGYVANQQRRIAVTERNAAQEALRLMTANNLLSRSLLERGRDPGLSVRLGAAAMAVEPSPEIRRELILTVAGTRFDGSALLSDPAVVPWERAAGASLDGGAIAGGWWGSDPDGHPMTVWDISGPSPRAASTVSGHSQQPTAIVFSPDRSLLATAELSTIILSDTSELSATRTLATLTGLDNVVALAISSDNRLLAAVGHFGEYRVDPTDGWLRLWDISDPTAPRELATRTGVYDAAGVAFTPDGATLVSGGGTLTIEGYDEDGNAYGTSTGATIWDISDPTDPRPDPDRLRPGADIVAISPTRPLLAQPSYARGTVALVDLSDPQDPTVLAELDGHSGDLMSVVFSADGHLLATAGGQPLLGGDEQTVRVWDLGDPAQPVLRAELPFSDVPLLTLGFSSDGSTLTTVDTDGLLTRWRVDSRGIYRVSGFELDGTTTATAVKIGPAGDLVAVVRFEGSAELWDVANPALPVRRSTFANAAEVVAFGPDGDLLATGSYAIGRGWDEVTLWDIGDPASPAVLATMRTPAQVRSVAFHPHRPLLTATGWPGDGPDWAGAWDISDPRNPASVEVPLEEPSPFQNVFSPDGSLLALGGAFWDVDGPGGLVPVEVGEVPQNAALLPGNGPLAFTADGARVLADDFESLTYYDIRDPASPRVLFQLPELGWDPVEYFITPDQRLIVAADSSGMAYVYDISNADRPYELLRHKAFSALIGYIDLAPDGTWFASSASAETVLWSLGDLPSIVVDPAGYACAVAGPLTAEEWQRYAPDYPPPALCG